MRIFHNTQIDFLGKRKLFYVVSLVFIVVGMIVLSINGIPRGIDFQGGTELQMRFEKDANSSDIRSIMDNAGLPGMEIKTMGDEKNLLLRTPIQGEGQTVADKIEGALKDNLKDNPFQVMRVDKVGPKIGKELTENALKAVIFSLFGILIYLSFRFQFVYSLGAVIALFHDVLITISAVAISDALIPGLRLELSQTMLAAFLTLIGFSVNDTVIIFDRIRENIKLFKNEDIE
jgi:preprotein translocase subunit SecF